MIATSWLSIVAALFWDRLALTVGSAGGLPPTRNPDSVHLQGAIAQCKAPVGVHELEERSRYSILRPEAGRISASKSKSSSFARSGSCWRAWRMAVMETVAPVKS